MIIIIFSQMIIGLFCLNCINHTVNINSQCIQNDVEPLTLSHQYENKGIKMNYSFEFSPSLSENKNQQYITMMIQINTTKLFSLCLGADQSQQDIWLFQFDQINQQFEVLDCVRYNQSEIQLDTKFGGVNDIILLGYNYDQNGTTSVKFKRLLITNDINDQVIKHLIPPLLVANGQTEKFDENKNQNDHDLFSIQFVQTQLVQQNVPINWFTTHQWINLICWGVLIDLPLIIIRNFKTYKWYINVHGGIMIVIIFASLFGNFTMIYQKTKSYQYQTFVLNTLSRQVHLILGTSATILIFLQLFTGILLRFQILSKDQYFSKIIQQKYFHMLTGTLIYILAKIQLFLGVEISMNDDLFILYIVFGFTLVWRSILEILFQYYQGIYMKFLNLDGPKNDNQINYPASFATGNIQYNRMNQFEYQSISQNFPEKKWAIFNNSVIDLSEHIHPGGQYIWGQVVGREVSRFIYGAYCLESTEMAKNIHSQYALKLLEKLTIGILEPVPLFSVEQTQFATWDINNQQDLTPNIKIFNLTRKDVSFSTALNGFENFGRYFVVRSNSNKDIATRNYTLVICMAKCNQEYRKQMVQRAIARFSSTQVSQDNISQSNFVLQDQFDQLPLIIKRYPSKNGFSQYIHAAVVGDQIQLSGPFGTSFGIQHEQKGSIVIVAGGTGIFPFLDLLDYLLKITLYQLYTERKFEMSEINPSQIDPSKYPQNQKKFILLFSVRSLSEMVGSDIYLTLAKIQKYLVKPNFELILKSADQTTFEGVQFIQNRFDHQFIHEKILNMNDVQKVLLSGPPSMNREISLGLESLGYSKEKIHLV